MKAYQKIIMALSMLALGAFPGLGWADTAEVTVKSLNVRQAPKTGAVLGTVKKGERYEVLETQNGWHKIKVGKMIGWVAANYTKISVTAKVEATPKPEAPKAETKPAETPKTEAKPEALKAETKPAEASKTEAQSPSLSSMKTNHALSFGVGQTAIEFFDGSKVDEQTLSFNTLRVGYLHQLGNLEVQVGLSLPVSSSEKLGDVRVINSLGQRLQTEKSEAKLQTGFFGEVHYLGQLAQNWRWLVGGGLEYGRVEQDRFQLSSDLKVKKDSTAEAFWTSGLVTLGGLWDMGNFSAEANVRFLLGGEGSFSESSNPLSTKADNFVLHSKARFAPEAQGTLGIRYAF